MAYLSDDGTLDTVIVCDNCGREHRFNYDPASMDDDFTITQGEDGFWRVLNDQGEPEFPDRYTTEQGASNALDAWLRDGWVESCIEEVEETCECGDEEES